MAKILLNNFGVDAAKAFRQDLDDNTYYIWLGNPNVWSNEASPPVPTGTIAEEVYARTNMEYLVKVTQSDSCLCIPLITWTIDTIYNQYSATDPLLYSEAFYVMNNNNVYKCFSNNSGANSLNPPTGQSPNTVITADGYNWKFMYDISSTFATNFMTNSFIPVPTGLQVSSLQLNVQNSAVYATGSPPKGHGYAAEYELGANSVIINKVAPFTALVTDFTHRQFGLIKNPLLTNGNPADAAVIVVDDTFDVMSGSMSLMNNHLVVSTSDDVSKTFQIVLSF